MIITSGLDSRDTYSQGLGRDPSHEEEAVLKTYEAQIRLFARRNEFKLVRTDEAQQSARLGLLKALRNFKRTAGANLWTFAANYMRGEIWRDYKPIEAEPVPETIADQAIEDTLSEVRARAIARTLPPAEAMAVELVVIDQLPAAEAARFRAVTRAAVSQALNRGLNRLRLALSSELAA